jgi:hypothetical protein
VRVYILGDDTWWFDNKINVFIHGGNMGMQTGCGVMCSVSYQAINMQSDLGFRA